MISFKALKSFQNTCQIEANTVEIPAKFGVWIQKWLEQIQITHLSPKEKF
jgi:hypothetical protein